MCYKATIRVILGFIEFHQATRIGDFVIFYIYLHLLYLKHISLIVLSTDITNSENIWMQRGTVSSLHTSGIFKTFLSAGISPNILPYFKVEPEIEYNKYLRRVEKWNCMVWSITVFQMLQRTMIYNFISSCLVECLSSQKQRCFCLVSIALLYWCYYYTEAGIFLWNLKQYLGFNINKLLYSLI